MKKPKIKTYVLMVAKRYPTHMGQLRFAPLGWHGQLRQTDFMQKIKNVLSRKPDLYNTFPEGLIEGDSGTPGIYGKIHTCRANYRLWKKRIDEVNQGLAVISIRQWSGRPYNSKQNKFAELSRGQVGIQKITVSANALMVKVDGKIVPVRQVAHNDGLTLLDFMAWFQVPIGTVNRGKKGFKGAVIHFSQFRYK